MNFFNSILKNIKYKKLFLIFLLFFNFFLNDYSFADLPILKSVRQIQTGSSKACAVTIDNELYCWDFDRSGSNNYEILPNLEMQDVSSVILVGSNQCAIKTDGKLYCWENNLPVLVLEDVSSVSLGNSHKCALKIDGKLYCWGDNARGQVGNGTTVSISSPVLVLKDVKRVTLGIYHTCALKINGDVYCWGYNNYGQVGNGLITNVMTPVKILGNIVSLTTNRSYTCALNTENKLICWGLLGVSCEYTCDYACGGDIDDDETFGIGDIIIMLSPTFHAGWYYKDIYHYDVNPTIKFTDVLKYDIGYEQVCAEKSNGNVFCIGADTYCQVSGNGNSCTPHTSVVDKTKIVVDAPVQVKIDENYLTNISKFILGKDISCAIKATGKMVCWGSRDYYKFGNGGSSSHEVSVLENTVDASIELYNTCAIEKNGSGYCWGQYMDDVTHPNAINSTPRKIFDGSSENVELSLEGCEYHWNYLNLNNTCSNNEPGQCLAQGVYICSNINGIPNIICNATIPANYPMNELCNGLNDNCDTNELVDEDFGIGDECHTENGIGENVCNGENDVMCNVLMTYTPSSTFTNTYTPSNTSTFTNTFTNTYTPSNTSTFTNTVTNTYTQTFTNTNTNTSTFTSTSTHTFTNTNTYTSTQTFTETYTPTCTNTPTNTYIATQSATPTLNIAEPENPIREIEVITPETILPPPEVKTEERKKILFINLPKIIHAAIKENSNNPHAKFKYLIHVRKIKRDGVRDKFYNLGKKVLTYQRKNKLKLKWMDKGIYSVRYQVIITNNKKTKTTKWSKRTLVEI